MQPNGFVGGLRPNCGQRYGLHEPHPNGMRFRCDLLQICCSVLTTDADMVSSCIDANRRAERNERECDDHRNHETERFEDWK